MDAPQSERFKELLKSDPSAGRKAVRAGIASSRGQLEHQVFEVNGKKYRVVPITDAPLEPTPTTQA